MNTSDLNTISVEEAAEELGCSPRTVRRLALAREITHLRVGRRGLIRITRGGLDDYRRRVTVAAQK